MIMNKLKVCIGSKIYHGPWGGGNLFSQNLSDYLNKRGYEVYTDLKKNDLDIILLTDPRFSSESSTVSSNEAKFYKRYINPNVKIIHRINECDERKNTKTVNKKILKSNNVADYTVYVSNWLKEIYEKLGKSPENSSVIYSGSNSDIFNANNFYGWNGVDKVKIVTHHWGNNWNKGFDIYSDLDRKLSISKFNESYEFTYIGNLPENFEFKNTTVYKPISGLELAEKLKENHLYLTASVNEPSGNHHIEGALCGLPILFLESGGTPEYAKNYGISFNSLNFYEKLEEIVNDYDIYKYKMKNYPYKSDKMCEEYLNLFILLAKNNSQTFNFKFNPFDKKLFSTLLKSYKKLYMKIIFKLEKIIKLYIK